MQPARVGVVVRLRAGDDAVGCPKKFRATGAWRLAPESGGADAATIADAPLVELQLLVQPSHQRRRRPPAMERAKLLAWTVPYRLAIQRVEERPRRSRAITPLLRTVRTGCAWCPTGHAGAQYRGEEEVVVR